MDQQVLANTWIMDVLNEGANRSLFLSLIPITMEYADDVGSITNMVANEYPPGVSQEMINRYITTLEELGMVKLSD